MVREEEENTGKRSKERRVERNRGRGRQSIYKLDGWLAGD